MIEKKKKKENNTEYTKSLLILLNYLKNSYKLLSFDYIFIPKYDKQRQREKK